MASKFVPSTSLYVFCLLLLTGLGCEPSVKVERVAVVEPSDEDPGDEPSPEEVLSNASDNADFPAAAWIEEAQLPYEFYEVQYLNGKQVGYSRTLVAKGESLFRVTREGSYAMPTPEGIRRYSLKLESLEYATGKMTSFNEVTSQQGRTIQADGQVSGPRIVVTTRSGAGPERSTAPWTESAWGVLGVQAVLMAKPMVAGETRTCEIFAPKLHRVIPTVMKAGEPEVTALPGGATPELVPIDVVLTIGDEESRSRNWINGRGEILKTVTFDKQVISTYRAPKTTAERIAGEMQVAENLGRTLEYYGPLPTGEERSAVYMVENQGRDLYLNIGKTVRQRVKSISALSSQVAVLDIWDRNTIREIEQDQPTEQDLADSEWVNLENPKLVAFSEQLIAAPAPAKVTLGSNQRQPTPMESDVLALVARVQGAVQMAQPTGRAASAAETARLKMADPTAKSILLVAMLRRAKIPARIAFGLRAERGQKPGVNGAAGAMGYYPWVEAWVDEHWLPVDPVAGGVTGLDCIKLSQSSLASTHPYDEMMTVYTTMGNTTVRRVEAEQ